MLDIWNQMQTKAKTKWKKQQEKKNKNPYEIAEFYTKLFCRYG